MPMSAVAGKAKTAVASGRESGVFERAVDGGGSGEGGHGRPRAPRLALLSAPQLVCMEGAVPVIVDGMCVGAVSVAGVSPEHDAQVAKAGVNVLSGCSAGAEY